MIQLPELEKMCQKLLIQIMNEENAFELLFLCDLYSLTHEIDWLCWFIGTQKMEIGTDYFIQFTSNPQLGSKVINQAINLTLPPPPTIKLTLKPIQDALEEMFNSSMYADFSLVLSPTGGRVHELKLHSAILSPWKFFSILQREKVHQPEMPIESFKKLIRYLYCERVDTIEFQDAVWLLSLKEYYLLDTESTLVRHCKNFVSEQLGSGNWVEAYQLGLQLNDPQFKEKAKSLATPPCPKQVICVLETQQTAYFQLKSETKDLKQQNQDLQATIKDLQATINALKVENEQLRSSQTTAERNL